MRENYGEYIKSCRLSMGLTQHEVAAALEVTPGYICNVENGRTAMSLKILIYYAKLMGRTLDSLVGDLDSGYQMSALDNEIADEMSKMTEEDKTKLLKILKIWNS